VLIDYHVHGLGHLDFACSRQSLERYLHAAREAGLEELGFSEHDEYLSAMDPEVYREIRRESRCPRVRLGLEVDYRESQPAELAEQWAAWEFDYLIGSVHYLGQWPFDHPDYREGYRKWQPDELYRQYFQQVARMAATRLFDVVGHFDLIKVFGYRSRQPVAELAYSALEAIRAADMVLEVNTSGWYKPVAELYPAVELLRLAWELGIPITFGSDAHQPGHVGRDLGRARSLAREIGYTQAVRFEKRKRELVELEES